MLDFYLIQDDQPKPDFPEQANLVFAGGLDHKTFEKFQNKGIIPKHYDYYSDLRWGTKIIAQQHITADQDKFKSDVDLQKFLDLLEKARINHCGLIAYCDWQEKHEAQRSTDQLLFTRDHTAEQVPEMGSTG